MCTSKKLPKQSSYEKFARNNVDEIDGWNLHITSVPNFNWTQSYKTFRPNLGQGERLNNVIKLIDDKFS